MLQARPGEAKTRRTGGLSAPLATFLPVCYHRATQLVKPNGTLPCA